MDLQTVLLGRTCQTVVCRELEIPRSVPRVEGFFIVQQSTLWRLDAGASTTVARSISKPPSSLAH